MGKGLGGFILKDLAAIIGPFGYTLKGVHKEIIKGSQPTAFIRRARIVQGIKAVGALDSVKRRREEERVERAWIVIQEIWTEIEEAKKGPLRQRIQFSKERRKLMKQGKFESVGNAAMELDRWRREKKLKALR